MRIAFCLMTVSLLFALFTVVASAATVARWTPAQASAKVRGKCVGVGKGLNGKYASFKCSKQGVVYAKVRPDGRILCYSRVSLAAVSKACMTVPGMGGAGAGAKSWEWTPQEAAAKLLAVQPDEIVVNGGRILTATCAGVTPASVTGHFTSFRCDISFRPLGMTDSVAMVAWVKTVSSGSGALLCSSRISFDAIRMGLCQHA